jgi:hypothetical protein
MQIKNISEGPRGVWSDGAVVMLMPGESRDLRVSKGDLEAARATGWFSLDGSSAADEPEEEAKPDAELDKLSDDELRAYLVERGVTVDNRWGRNRLLTQAEKVKG